MQGPTVQSLGARADRAHRISMGLAAGLLVAAFAPTLVELVRAWIERPEYSHGFLMPVVAGWLLWERRDQLAALEPRMSMSGILLLVPALAMLLLGEMKLSWFLKPYAFIGSLGALVWTFYGWRGVRACFPVLIVLLLMCPLPGRIQRDLTLPLKRTAALFATGMLDLTGVHATLEGNIINLPGIDRLWVADACSGIRSLISLGSLAILAVILWKRHWLLRAAVLVASVPIAVLVNGLRIWLTGLLSMKVGPGAAQGFFHFFEGFVLFAVAALLLLGWAALLAWAFPARRAS
jgi:exosortase